MNIIELEEVDSTNSYVERNAAGLLHGCVVTARNQRSGRGQRGNSWESEPGSNLTFTMLLRPSIAAVVQFSLSEAVALSVCDMLDKLCGVECKVKWPNDIYTGDKKICGILISHSLSGRHINYSVVGMGININQKVFHSDAPNPVSVIQLTGQHHKLRPLLQYLAEKIEHESLRIADSDYRNRLHNDYMSRLWRGDGKMHPFRDATTGEEFSAVVSDVEPTGHILLRLTDNTLQRYAFKEFIWLK